MTLIEFYEIISSFRWMFFASILTSLTNLEGIGVWYAICHLIVKRRKICRYFISGNFENWKWLEVLSKLTRQIFYSFGGRTFSAKQPDIFPCTDPGLPEYRPTTIQAPFDNRLTPRPSFVKSFHTTLVKWYLGFFKIFTIEVYLCEMSGIVTKTGTEKIVILDFVVP